jgi:uncharacterized protein with von Willebrand factor type A (vWA) domain
MAEPLVANLLLFGRLLRRAGLPVHHSRLLDAVRALTWVGVGRREDVRAALLALLVHRHDDIARFDAAFTLFFRDPPSASSGRAPSSPGERPRVGVGPAHGAAIHVGLGEASGDGDAADAAAPAVGAYSASAVSRTRDFAEFSPTEMETAHRLLAGLPWRLGKRRTRRWDQGDGTSVNLRPTLRRAMSQGEILELDVRRRRTAPRPIVFIGDVSGSMERYSRVLMHFVYGLARHVRHVESFVFATTLTRLTHRVVRPGAERQLTAVIRSVSDWGGGTRIGESLRRFNTHWARRVMRHGPVVVLVSDGWDRGDPAILARELARVRRGCRRLMWLNPLLGGADYEPLTRGMQAALPYVDDFLPAHNIASLEHLADRLNS